MAYRTTHEPDHEELGRLLKRAAGNRKLREYARDAGIPHSRLFEIKRKGGSNPSINTLIRLASPAAKPQDGVTLEDFLEAAGYAFDFEGIGKALSNFASAVTPIVQEYQEFQNKVTKAVTPVLEASGISFEHGDTTEHHYFGYQPDMILLLRDQRITSLWFDFCYAVDETDPKFIPEIKAAELIREPAAIDSDPSRKNVIVVESPVIFKALSKRANHTSYRGNLSAILLDTENGQILERVTLSTYDVGSADPLDIL